MTDPTPNAAPRTPTPSPEALAAAEEITAAIVDHDVYPTADWIANVIDRVTRDGELRQLLALAVKVIDGLYDQQAIPDESQRPDVDKIRAALSPAPKEQK